MYCDYIHAGDKPYKTFKGFLIVLINLNGPNWRKRILELQKSINKHIGCLT